jgi:LysR family transcriptional activator of nhaA
VKVFSHLLGESDTAFFAPAPQAAKLRRRFPRSLHDAPLMVPTVNTALRHALDEWFDAEGLRPRIVGQFEDSALMKAFGRSAGVVFPAPAAIEADVCRFYDVRVISVYLSIPDRPRYSVWNRERSRA